MQTSQLNKQMTMKYHAGKHGFPKCGTRGRGSRFNVVCLTPSEWAGLAENSKCSKCAEAIRRALDTKRNGANE